MALKKCRERGKKVSTEAASCPSCGAPNPTFKKSSELASVFKLIPNDRILVETDSPYLSPDPLRGKSNEPSHIIHTIKFLSKLKDLDENKFSNITTQNFFNLFGKLN